MLLHHLVRNRGAGFTSAVLIGSHPGLNSPEERRQRRERDQQWIQILQSMGPARFFSQWKTQPLLRNWEDTPEDQKQATLRQAAAADPSAWSRILETLSPGRLPPLEKELESLDLPLLLLAGEQDRNYVDYYRELAPRLPRAHAVFIPEAGHAAHLDRPEAVLQAAFRFMARF